MFGPLPIRAAPRRRAPRNRAPLHLHRARAGAARQRGCRVLKPVECSMNRYVCSVPQRLRSRQVVTRTQGSPANASHDRGLHRAQQREPPAADFCAPSARSSWKPTIGEFPRWAMPPRLSRRSRSDRRRAASDVARRKSPCGRQAGRPNLINSPVASSTTSSRSNLP